MLPHIRLKTTIFNYFVKYFTNEQIVEILKELIIYFQSQQAKQLYDIIHKDKNDKILF